MPLIISLGELILRIALVALPISSTSTANVIISGKHGFIFDCPSTMEQIETALGY